MRKFQIDFEGRGKGLESAQILQIEPNCIDIDKIDISPFKLGNDVIEGDRMIPLRSAVEIPQKKDNSNTLDSFNPNNIYDVKLAIENNPPEFLNEDKRLEQPMGANNNIQDPNVI